MNPSPLPSVSLPPGRYGVAVSGGGDSVAALLAVATMSPVVIHLDHQTRGDESAADAAFVADLALGLKLPAVIRRRDEIESDLTRSINNPSARYRSARLDLYRLATGLENLDGIILAHHADDQAETVLIRLLHGRGPGYVTGMSAVSVVDGVRLLRPFLNVRSSDLRRYAASLGFHWREDASNQSDDYLRNRLRSWRNGRGPLDAVLLELHSANVAVDGFVTATTPVLPARFAASELADLPAPQARLAARRWLIAAGCDRQRINSAVCHRLTDMATDPASPAVRIFPGNLSVRRSDGMIAVSVAR